METSSSPSFAALLKRYRRAAGLTQEALAERAGYSTAYLSKLEQGVRTPLPLTVELLAEALQLALSERAALEAAGRQPAPAAPRASPRLQSQSPSVGAGQSPLIGRVAERTQLARLLAGEGPPLVILVGEPGIGKTRLLQEAASMGYAQGLSVLTGGCHRRSGQDPYAPFAATLAETLARWSLDEQERLLAGCEWLVRLLPELAEAALLSAPTWILPPAQERRLMFAAVGRLLANIAGPAGTLLVLDDLQWAGADALDLCASLVRSASGSLRVVGAYRQTEVRPGDSLSLFLSDLTREGLVDRTELGPLTSEEATTLLMSLLEEIGEGPRAAVAQRILARAGGVPYFLVSCVQGLLAGAAGVQGEDVLPQNVADSIRQRVALLPEIAQYLLEAAAVVGREVPRSLLLAVSAPLEWGQREVLMALDFTCRARLLVEQDAERYAFAHDLIREVVLAGVSAARRALLHQQVAEALECGPEEAPVERLAYHYQRAGLLEKAVVYLERAGDRARAIYAQQEAEHSYQELVRLLTRLGYGIQVAAAQEKLAGVLEVGARHSEALGILEGALAVYQAAQDVEGQARVMALMGNLHAARGTSTDGITLLERWLASPQASAASSQSRGMLSLDLAYLFLNSGRYQEALSATQQAADLAQQAQDDHLLGLAQWQLGRSLMLLNRLEEAILQFEAALPLLEGAGDMRGLYYILLNLSLIWQDRGELSEGRLYAERALVFAEQMGDPILLARILSTHAFNQFIVGEWQRSRQEYERALALMRQASMPWGATYPLLHLGLQLLCEGQAEGGLAALEEAISLAERSQDREARRLAQGILATYDILLGSPQHARQRLEPLLEDTSLEESGATSLLARLAWAHLESGDAAQAQTLVEQALARTRAQQLRLRLPDVLHVQARVAAHNGRWDKAEQALEEMLMLARILPCPYDEAKAHYVAGLVSVQQGQAAEARIQFEAALTILHRLGERLYTGRVEQAIAALAL